MTVSLKPEFIDNRQLISKIKPGNLLITGNQRLARSLQKIYDLSKIKQGLSAWETPDILPWSAWLERIACTDLHTDNYHKKPVLLTTAQEYWVWEQIIADLTMDNALLQVSATARQCSAGWRLMHEWQLSNKDFTQAHNEDSRFFLKCCQSFKARCAKNTWISSAELPDYLSDSIKSSMLVLPESIILTGFDELNPQQLSLFTQIEIQSCHIQWLEKKSIKSSASYVRLNHEREEINMAARWARQLVESDNSSRVGIVVPELSEKKTLVQGVFDRVFIAQTLRPENVENNRPYNISMGSSLLDYPMIQTGVQLLQWQIDLLAIEEVSAILHSPYIGGWQQERFSRSRLSRHLREYRKHEVSLALLLNCARNNTSTYHCPLLVLMLERFLELLKKLPTHDTARNWARHFSALLSAFEFNQGRTLNSDEYQTAAAWNEQLGDFVRLDSVSDNMSYQAAYRHLRQLTSERVFQPQSGDVPVQVLGMMEASSLEFDYLWVMGMHDGVWPPTPQANQFIPVSLQRDKMMPHSSAKRELFVASQVTRRLVGNAAEVIFSYPSSAGDEVLRPSPLITEFRSIAPTQISYWQDALWDKLVFAASQTEKWKDSKVPLTEVETVTGGSQIFKLQSACPFRAFAESRLDARPMTEASLGLDPAERGSLIHQVLENFWSKLKDQQTLLELSEDELKRFISECVGKAITHYEKRLHINVSNRFRMLEQNRLQAFVYDWMLIEKQRPYFSVINTEQKVSLLIRNLPINLKIDRVDELANGERIVIDYKTGNVTPSQWFGERPEEPQLPLYSVALPEHLAGLVFAQLKPGECSFKGITQEEGLMPEVKSFQSLSQTKVFADWNELMTEWHQVINHLAEDFKQGNAAVDPLNYPHTCKYCNLTQFCRINQMSASETIMENEDSL